MPEDFEALAAEVLDDLKNTGTAFWENLNEVQRPIVEQAARDLARYSLKLITDPANAAQYKEDILFIRSTLESEAALTALQATNRLKEALRRGLTKLVSVGLMML